MISFGKTISPVMIDKGINHKQGWIERLVIPIKLIELFCFKTKQASMALLTIELLIIIEVRKMVSIFIFFITLLID